MLLDHSVLGARSLDRCHTIGNVLAPANRAGFGDKGKLVVDGRQLCRDYRA